MDEDLKRSLREAYLAAASKGSVAVAIVVGDKFAASRGIHATQIDLDIVELPIEFVAGSTVALRVTTTTTNYLQVA